MLYTEESRIGALAVHIVGNKAKDEPLMVSPSLSDQLSDAPLMQTLLAYFMGGFKSEEYFNLYHDTDLTCNEVWNFTCRIFDDPESFYDHSVSLARHLYETGMHPQIKSGEFYVVYFTDCRFGGETVDAVGLFKSETRDTFLDVEEQASGLHIAAHQGINVSRSASWTTPTAPKHAIGSTISCTCASVRITTTIPTTRWPCARST